MTAAEGAVDASPKAGKSWMQGFVNNDEAPYSYTTESGEKYDVSVVTYKFGKKVETGTITFGNGDMYEGDWSMGSKNGKGIRGVVLKHSNDSHGFLIGSPREDSSWRNN